MRHANILVREQSVLLVADVQERLAAVMSERDRLVRSARKAILAARLLSVPIVVTEQYPKGLGPTVAELRELIPDDAPMVHKLSFSCCSEQDFLDTLAGQAPRRSVLVVGMEAHICVYQTVLDLVAREYSVHVAADGICSRRRRDESIAIESMRASGVVVTTVESAIFQWAGRAGSPEFKEVLKIVK